MRKTSLPWIDSALHQLMRARNYFMKKYCKTRDISDWDSYKDLCNQVRRQLRCNKAVYFENVCQENVRQPGKAWMEVNKAHGRSSKKCILVIDVNGHHTTDMCEIVQDFNSYFTNLTLPLPDRNAGIQVTPVNAVFKFAEIDEEDVLHMLCHLNMRKSTGVDGISARMLKMAAPAISESLTRLFNISLETGQIPSLWKEANVTPVPKGGNNLLVKDYRPISILPVVSKIYESIVHKQLFTYLESHSLLHQCQSGFRPGHCTQDVLLKTTDDWRLALDRSELVGTVLIDFSKAFDSIDHTLLCRKFEMPMGFVV